MRRFSLPFLAALTLAISPVAFLNCSGNGDETCDATSCAGCCNSQGQCVTGDQSNACGINGAACSDCIASGMACLPVTQMCGTGSTGGNDAGTDAGTDAGMDAGTDAGMDMDAGTDGGMTSNCTELTMFVRDDGFGEFEADEFASGNLFRDASGGRSDWLWLDLYPGQDGTFASTPRNYTFSPSVPYLACEVCLGLFEDCDDDTGACTGYFYATGGTVAVSALSPARIAASGSSIQFVEWDFSEGGTDAPVPGGRCINLTTLTIDESI